MIIETSTVLEIGKLLFVAAIASYITTKFTYRNDLKIEQRREYNAIAIECRALLERELTRMTNMKHLSDLQIEFLGLLQPWWKRRGFYAAVERYREATHQTKTNELWKHELISTDEVRAAIRGLLEYMKIR